MARIVNLISIFFILLCSGQSWGLVVPVSSDSYRYDGSRITENTQIRDYDVFQKLLGAEVRKPLESLSETSLDRYLFAFIDGFDVTNKGGGAVIGRMDDLTAPGALRPGEYTLLDRLPDLGSPKANYYQNMSVLRQEMRAGRPIRDVSDADTALAPTKLNPTRTIRQTFTGAERNQLTNRGWTFDGEYWNPPR